jgi:peptidoglycan/LPS O-acetylase OafA/YrhL
VGEIKQRYEINILGPLRFFFAASVIARHLWGEPAGDAARHAVIGFFCISGYLITRIRLNNYCGRPGAFLFNFLRIYPQYALAIMLGALMVILLPAIFT